MVDVAVVGSSELVPESFVLTLVAVLVGSRKEHSFNVFFLNYVFGFRSWVHFAPNSKQFLPQSYTIFCTIAGLFKLEVRNFLRQSKTIFSAVVPLLVCITTSHVPT